MVNLNDAVAVLRAKREELLNQLAAVDKAIDALSGDVVPTRVKSPRILSDDHKHAINEGRRKARHSKDAAKGLARELLDPPPVPGPATARTPRLVKRRNS